MTTPPAKGPTRPWYRRKRYPLALLLVFGCVGLLTTGTVCVPLTDGLKVCVTVRVVRLQPPASELGQCTPDMDGANALYGGDEAVCMAGAWKRPDGGDL